MAWGGILRHLDTKDLLLTLTSEDQLRSHGICSGQVGGVGKLNVCSRKDISREES